MSRKEKDLLREMARVLDAILPHYNLATEEWGKENISSLGIKVTGYPLGERAQRALNNYRKLRRIKWPNSIQIPRRSNPQKRT